MFNTFNLPDPWPRPLHLQTLPFWQRAVCDCHYFYQFFLCGCPDHPLNTNTTTNPNNNNPLPNLPNTHTPNFRPCAIAQSPKIDQLRHLLTGFRHNRTPPIRREPSILPFPCFRHLQEARQYLPPAALRDTRKRLLNPKWNPVGVRRFNENYRGMVRFMGGMEHAQGGFVDEEEGGEEEMEVDEREGEEVREKRSSDRRVSFLDLENRGEQQQQQQQQQPLQRVKVGKRKRGREMDWSSREDWDYNNPFRPRSRRRSSDHGQDEISVEELDPSTDMDEFYEEFQNQLARLEQQRQGTVRHLGIDNSGLGGSPPNQPVTFDRPPDNAWMFDTEPMVTDYHSAMSTPNPSQNQNQIQMQDLAYNSPPSTYPSPPPAYRRTPPATRPHSRHQSMSTISPGYNASRGVSKSHTSSAARHKAATTNPFQALAWLVEEQTADLCQQDGYRWRCALPRVRSNTSTDAADTASYYPNYPWNPYHPHDPQLTNTKKDEPEKVTHYDTSSHTGYHTGAYRLDDSILHQSRLAQWAGANPGPGVYAGVIPDAPPPYSLANPTNPANPNRSGSGLGPGNVCYDEFGNVYWDGSDPDFNQAGFNNFANNTDRNNITANSGPPVWAGGSCANAFCQRERVRWGGSKARCCPLCPEWRVNRGFVRGDGYGGYGGGYNGYDNPSIQPTYNSGYHRHRYTSSSPPDYDSANRNQNYNNPYQKYNPPNEKSFPFYPSNNTNTSQDHSNTIHPAAASSWGMIMAERVRQIWEEFVSGWSSTTSGQGEGGSPRRGGEEGKEGDPRGGWWGWKGGWLSM